MKKVAVAILLVLFAMMMWEALFDPVDMHLLVDGEHLHGPLGALAALLAASGGIVLGVAALLLTGVLLMVLFAGLGILFIALLALAALIVAVAASPLLLPLLIPIALIWYFASRNSRKHSDLKTEPV